MSDIPEDLVAQISGQLHVHTTALFKVWNENGQRLSTHIGSGTFVSVGKAYGILTAQHVAELVVDPFMLGLSAAREGQEDAMSVSRDKMRIFEVAKRESDEFGPDLAFILLSDWEDVSTIKASRSFYPMEYGQKELSDSPPPIDAGIWFVCGSPGEHFVEEESKAGFLKILSFKQTCFPVNPSKQFERGSFDYIDLELNARDTLPTSFGGVSGGGLWQVTIERLNDGRYISRRYLLSGVAYYEQSPSNGARFIRCHGSKSIYSPLVQVVKGRSG